MQTAYARMVYDRHQRNQRADGGRARRRATLAHLLKDACRRLIAFLFTQVGVCGLVVAYNIMGAFAFRAIEGEYGDAAPEEAALQLREDAVKRLWNITARLNILEQTKWRQEVTRALEDFQGDVVPLVKAKGYRGVLPSQAWSFSAALMYSLSVYTTIGYGNLTPRTEWGKIATILYAIVGMPLMLLYMSNVGEVLAHIFKFIYFRVCSCDAGSMGYYRSGSGNLRPIPVTARRAEEPKEGGKKGQGSRRTVPITYCLMVIAIYVACGGAVFSQWERWSLLDACYFSYISLSTIGFGDLVPGRTVAGKNEDEEVESQQIIVTVYLLVGSALVAMCFNLMQEETIENLKIFWRRLGCLRKNSHSENEEGPSVTG
ncbi:potassium channel subfamily K member 18-like [Portunus trituberculatus]|uniref:potassium channel subfamily K member 18-like n=1 Tax=Portunus trituberculatus TaxID=210409 RepID=UPI001E1D1030|nr:potassium channel subfamily K member 18-like [Portunus trituberculatus]XP_045129801.1 potassium channel subfamily K member 18-like [Portunus trituberculatus]XP_045129802.1 potassium channel subfamily K member 18-like [Portunus trituberculatus]